MCGIVGVASPTALTIQMKEFFQDLLFHDEIRGRHATGIAAIDTMDKSLSVEKKAVPAHIFLQDKEAMENLFAFKHNFNIYIGHNRWATSGAKDDDNNAHPFIHGDIVGVHNGSLRNQKLLADSEKFVVDSDNLFYHLDNHGLDDTISKTNGAYALVWYNKEEGSLNFLRNDERPIAIGKLSNGCWVWASEMGMLTWLVKRHKQLSWATYKDNGVEYNCVHQLDPMKHMKFDFAPRSRAMPVPRLITKTAPVFPTSSYYGWPDDNEVYSRSARSQRTQHQNSTSSTAGTSSTEYGKRITETLAKFLAGGAQCGSMLELEYLGKHEEASKTGYLAKMELFKYQSRNGKVVIFHQYQHDNSFTKDWDESKIGTRLYGAIANVVEINNSTYGCLKNEELGVTMGVTQLTGIKPNRYWPYCDEAEMARQAVLEAAKPPLSAPAKQEGENTANVLPFRVPQQAPASSTEKLGSPDSKGQLTLLSEQTTPDDFMNSKVFLANGFMKQKEYIEACTLNAARCAECARSLTNIATTNVWLYVHFDRDVGTPFDYLHCSRRCYIVNKEECDMIDQDYDKRFGGKDD